MIPALLALAVLLPPAAPDYIPSGWKGVRLHLTVESGAGMRGLCFAHRVRLRETLAQVAEVELGDAARAGEIAARNPGVDLEHLEFNSYLWLPPAAPPLDGEEHTLVYVDTGRQVGGPGPLPFEPGEVSGAVTRNGELVLYLVPVAQAEAFERARGERRRPDDGRPHAVTRVVEAGAVTAVRCPIGTAYVREDAPIAGRVDVFRLERDPETGAMSLTLRSSQARDDRGEPLGAAAAGDGGPRKRQALLLLSLSGAGLAGLWALARYRRPRAAAGVA